MQNVRRFIQIASLAAVAFAATACGKITIPVNLVMNPAKTNEFKIDLGSDALKLPLTGGLASKIALDTNKLFSPQGIAVIIAMDSVEIAGASASFAGLETGTLCARENKADPTVATAFVKIFGTSVADFALSSEATSTLLAGLVPGGILRLAVAADDVPLKIDLKKLLRLDLSGVSVETVIEGTLPADVPLLGGAPLTMTVALEGSLKKATGPLLDECRPFFDAN